MKRITFLAAAALACGIIEVASAADLAVKGEPPQLAPSWTGFYIGVHGGAAWQSSPQFTFFDPNAPGDGILPVQNLSGGASKPGLGGVGVRRSLTPPRPKGFPKPGQTAPFYTPPQRRPMC
jgi:opacity protein-like surface antigen